MLLALPSGKTVLARSPLQGDSVTQAVSHSVAPFYLVTTRCGSRFGHPAYTAITGGVKRLRFESMRRGGGNNIKRVFAYKSILSGVGFSAGSDARYTRSMRAFRKHERTEGLRGPFALAQSGVRYGALCHPH
jgi:hypothetical protein